MPHHLPACEPSRPPCGGRGVGDVIPFALKRAAARTSVTALCQRLDVLDRAARSNGTTGDRIIDAQLAVVAALGRVHARDLNDVVGKLEVVIRGIHDGEGWTSSGHFAVLCSVLVDLGRIASVGTTAGRLMTSAERDPTMGTTP